MATLKELSEYTGFSITTISRVLNNDPTMKVTDATRAAILEAAGKLQYKASPRARRAHPERQPILHLAIAEMLSPTEQLGDPYYLYLNKYAEQYCYNRGYHFSHLSKRSEVFCFPTSGSIDGILAIGIFSEAQVANLAEISDNIVFLDSAPDELQHNSVVLNFELGIEQAIDYLLARGHTRIGFLGPNYKLDQKKRPAPEARQQHFIRYMTEKGLFSPGLLFDTRMTAESARGLLCACIQSGSRLPTALLAANEEMAIGAISAFQEHGLRIPQDISIISFNDTPLSTLTDPPLTSINTHLDTMSAVAVDLLADWHSAPRPVPMKVVIPPSLTERGSVAAL